MPVARKKTIVRRFSAGPMWGYLPGSGFANPQAGTLEVLDLAGHIATVPLSDVKYVAFVRDFNSSDNTAPERLLRKTFLARPRVEGLWLRLRLRDEDVLEGMAPLDASLADGWMEDGGVFLVPPDIRGNTQRLFVPRSAISVMDVLAVVTTPSKKKPEPVKPEQPDLFAFELPPDARLH